MTDDAFATDGAGTTTATPPLDPQTAPASAGPGGGTDPNDGSRQTAPGSSSASNAPNPSQPPVAPAPEASVSDAAKTTPKLGTISSTIGAGLSKDLYKSPVEGVKGLYKAQYQVGSDLTSKALSKVGVKTGAKVLARAIPGIGSLYAGYEAYKSFKDGNYIAGVLNLIGVIPGPIGWIGMGAAAAWDMFKPHKTYGMWDAPDGTSTHMLPASAKDVAGVKELDAKLREAQQSVFSFQDGPAGTVWNENHPTPLTLNSQAASAAFTNWLGGLSDLFAQIDQTMASSGEPYFQQYRQELAPHLQAMVKLKEQIKPLTDQLAAASSGGQKCYRGVLDINQAVRQQLANDGALSDQGAISGPQVAIQSGVSMIRDANSKLSGLFDGPPPVVISSKSPAVAASTTEKSKTEKTPITTTSTPTPLAAPEKKLESKGDDLGKLLSGLGNKGLGGAPGGSPLGGSPLGGGHGGGTPLTTPTSKPADTEPKKLVEDKKDDTKKREEKSLPKPLPTNNPVAPVTPAPTTPAPGTPAPGAPKPAASPTDTTVDVKGKKTKFPDAKTAKMAKLLAAADPNHPVSLADAAAQSGLTPPVPGQDPGKQIPPADAKPGDFVVAGDKHYMVLGDGKFYDLSQYKNIDASELPHDMGSRAGYFRLPDPGAVAAGPVSGPTSGVPFSVPGATDAPTAPADTSAAGGPAAQPTAAHPPASAAQSVPSTGSPGVPKSGGSAPANAAATDTGGGSSVPSSTVHNLDPGAVK